MLIQAFKPISKATLAATRVGSLQKCLLRCQSTHTFVPKPNSRVRRIKTKEQLAQEKFEEQLSSDHWWVRWGAVARSEKFTKGMTKYLIGIYIVFLFFGGYYMKKLYRKDKELEHLQKKVSSGDANEYEQLRIKELRNKLRTRDRLKLEVYNKMKEEGRENFDGVRLDNNDENRLNKNILPSRDTTGFYDKKAEEYDAGVNFEEKAIFMGKRRKWLMRHCEGDVLEVACGTGRNIKYLDPSRLNSITFLDSSEKMMEITHKKFRDMFPRFKKAAFVVGKAENLVDLAQGTSIEDNDGLKTNNKDIGVIKKGSTKVKYDTILEAFGLCSHEDPVRALKNFAVLLKPGGRIVLLEHGRGQYDFVNKILDQRAEKRLQTWGCRWNLDIGEILDDSGLEIVEESRSHLGTTWCIVAKKKGDIKKKNEIGFFEKYFQIGTKREGTQSDGPKK
ncbi:probable Methyltransferase OMS1, mitochondrial [Zygosaccharomyces bailii ISA1307]|uniref:BN860_18096g1_1 n=1 Tax=Zygosaccharomyces bailii (strain CLIB 213 / ATCC 58445 / CBS 680 / BCRC 21525 / NBRC 1098 / NCYC 1416 / NRRL Y-2227) TaxID=1333698 RepID=A0A8J2T4D2_ZYGB2|nr:BN860_18096g1_1 [Zygosaccharomyces bailii CLIB 213]CDH12199.1 probable Methyltransferase OMS1, mitochondrial [Zygosaccharomyces bailii ISA1307]